MRSSLRIWATETAEEDPCRSLLFSLGKINTCDCYYWCASINTEGEVLDDLSRPAGWHCAFFFLSVLFKNARLFFGCSLVLLLLLILSFLKRERERKEDRYTRFVSAPTQAIEHAAPARPLNMKFTAAPRAMTLRNSMRRVLSLSLVFFSYFISCATLRHDVWIVCCCTINDECLVCPTLI